MAVQATKQARNCCAVGGRPARRPLLLTGRRFGGLGQRWLPQARSADTPDTPERAQELALPHTQAAVLEAQQAQQPQQLEGPAPDQPARFSLYNWLRFSGLPTSSKAAAAAAPGLEQAQAQQLEQQHDDAFFSPLGDGMAAVAAETQPGPSGALASSSRSFLSLRRRSGAAAATSSAAAAAAEPAGSAMSPLDANHPTLRLMRQRLAEGSRPGARRDGAKLGLVVEGGGMRGCVSGGALQALSDLGLRDLFDAVYGSSAGAINSTYFLSGQREGVSIYHRDIAHAEFIDLKRLWRSEPGNLPVLNLSYLIDHVMHHVSPLNWDAVVQSEIPLKVVASSLDVLQPVILSDFKCKDDLALSLKASANVPEIAGAPIEHRGHRLVDAAVFEPVPFRSAIADGCTHVLVLCTRPKRERKGVLLPLEEAIEAAIKKAILSPDYMVPAWKKEVEYLAKDGLSQDDMLLRSFDENAHELPWFAGAHVFPLYPGPGASFSPLCTDVPTLKGGVAEGRQAVMRLAQALLADVLEQQQAQREDALALESNILPMPISAELLPLPRRQAIAPAASSSGGRAGGLSRLWRR